MEICMAEQKERFWFLSCNLQADMEETSRFLVATRV